MSNLTTRRKPRRRSGVTRPRPRTQDQLEAIRRKLFHITSVALTLPPVSTGTATIGRLKGPASDQRLKIADLVDDALQILHSVHRCDNRNCRENRRYFEERGACASR